MNGCSNFSFCHVGTSYAGKYKKREKNSNNLFEHPQDTHETFKPLEINRLWRKRKGKVRYRCATKSLWEQFPD